MHSRVSEAYKDRFRVLGGDFRCALRHLSECSAGLLKCKKTTSGVLGGDFRCALGHLSKCSAGLLECIRTTSGVLGGDFHCALEHHCGRTKAALEPHIHPSYLDGIVHASDVGTKEEQPYYRGIVCVLPPRSACLCGGG